MATSRLKKTGWRGACGALEQVWPGADVLLALTWRTGVRVCAVVKLQRTLQRPAAARVAGAAAGARDRPQHFIPRSALQPAAETLLLLQSSAIFWYFLQKKFTNRILFFLTLCVINVSF